MKPYVVSRKVGAKDMIYFHSFIPLLLNFNWVPSLRACGHIFREPDQLILITVLWFLSTSNNTPLIQNGCHRVTSNTTTLDTWGVGCEVWRCSSTRTDIWTIRSH